MTKSIGSMGTHDESIEFGLDGWYGKTWIHSACILYAGKLYAGTRYPEIVRKMTTIHKLEPGVGLHGFLTNEGKFISRAQAAKLALDNMQILAKRWDPDELLPEELWTEGD